MDKSKINELKQKWDEGCENGTLDPGQLFEDLIVYCEKLEKEINILRDKLIYS